MAMDTMDIAAYSLMLLVKSGVISAEDMRKTQEEDIIHGIEKLLRKTSRDLDEKNGIQK